MGAGVGHKQRQNSPCGVVLSAGARKRGVPFSLVCGGRGMGLGEPHSSLPLSSAL